MRYPNVTPSDARQEKFPLQQILCLWPSIYLGELRDDGLLGPAIEARTNDRRPGWDRQGSKDPAPTKQRSSYRHNHRADYERIRALEGSSATWHRKNAPDSLSRGSRSSGCELDRTDLPEGRRVILGRR